MRKVVWIVLALALLILGFPYLGLVLGIAAALVLGVAIIFAGSLAVIAATDREVD